MVLTGAGAGAFLSWLIALIKRKTATATIKNVTIESHHNYISKLHYIIDENISEGMSGGPLINKKNEVVGIITNGGQQQANGNRCIAISNIIDKL